LGVAAAEECRITAEEQRTLAEQQKKTAEEQRQQADDILARAETIIVNLGKRRDVKTQEEAFALLMAGAIHGDVPSMYDLGVYYQNGYGVAQDYAKARQWYEKAAAKDNAADMNNLAILYHEGQGVAQDYVTEREWLEKAAAKDNADAMVNLAALYENGLGVPQDYAKAREWIEKAAAKDNMDAKTALEQLTIREAATAGRYDEALRLDEVFAAKIEADATKREGKPGNETAGELTSVVWYALFAKEFTKGLTIADRAHTLFPSNLMIETNRAHALMFMGHDEEAKALYLAHIGEPIAEVNNKLREQAIAEDFGKLREAGLTRPMMAEIEKELGISR
jgi:hypothetical protein